MIDDDGPSSLRRARPLRARLDLPRMRRPEPRPVPALARLAVSQMTTYRWSLPDAVAAFPDFGIPAIGLWRPKLLEFGEERGIDLVEESGLAVSSLAWAGGFTGSQHQTFAEAIDDAAEAVRLAGRLRADSLVVVSGGRAGHTQNHARRLLLDALKRLGDDADEHNVTLGVQPFDSGLFADCSFLNGLDQTLDVLTTCDHPRVRMIFDVYHLWQEADLLRRVAQVAPWVALVRLSDWRDPPRSQQDRCLIGDGEIPLASIVRAFLGAGYEGRFEIDVWSEELWAGDYRGLLRQCTTRFVELFERAS